MDIITGSLDAIITGNQDNSDALAPDRFDWDGGY